MDNNESATSNSDRDRRQRRLREIKTKARKSQLRCEYILGRRDIVETEQSRYLKHQRELKKQSDLGLLADQVDGK